MMVDDDYWWSGLSTLVDTLGPRWSLVTDPVTLISQSNHYMTLTVWCVSPFLCTFAIAYEETRSKMLTTEWRDLGHNT